MHFSYFPSITLNPNPSHTRQETLFPNFALKFPEMAQKHIFVFLALVSLVYAIKLDLIKEEYGTLGTKMAFYEEEYQNGQDHFIDLGVEGACRNLPRRWLKKASSVDTRGTCGSVCTEKDCQGTCVIIIPGNGEQLLSQVKMNKKIQSVQGCFVEGSQKGKP